MGMPCFSTCAFTRVGDWFTDTATATSLILPAYFFDAAVIAGSSCLQFGHHVAQNSMSTGVLPTYWPRSNGCPSSVSTATELGALDPTGRPVSCACSGSGIGNGERGTDRSGNAATAIAATAIRRPNFISTAVPF